MIRYFGLLRAGQQYSGDPEVWFPLNSRWRDVFPGTDRAAANRKGALNGRMTLARSP